MVSEKFDFFEKNRNWRTKQLDAMSLPHRPLHRPSTVNGEHSDLLRLVSYASDATVECAAFKL